MKPFVQFMTIENLRVFIDPQAIIAFCEFKFRENDIGYVGTRIEYTGNDSTLVTFTVKDPIDAVADALAGTPKGIDIPALNETLICNMALKEPDPVLYHPYALSSFLVELFAELNKFYWDTTNKLIWVPQIGDVIVDEEGSIWSVTEANPPVIKAKTIGLKQENAQFSLDCIAPYFTQQVFDVAIQEFISLRTNPIQFRQELELNNFRQAMQEKGAKAAQDRVATVLTQSVKEQEKVLDNLAKILQQPDSRLDFETDTQKKSFNWADYRPLERGEKIYAADKVNVKGLPFSVNPDMIGKSYSSIFDTQVYRQYVFQPGDTVQHIHAYDEPIYKVIKTVEDLSGHLYCVLEGRKQSVRVRELVLYTPPTPTINLQVRPTPTTYRTPPQETPPCNGNGEAQSTEE